VLRWRLNAQVFGVKGWVLGVGCFCMYLRMHVCVYWARAVLPRLLNAQVLGAHGVGCQM